MSTSSDLVKPSSWAVLRLALASRYSSMPRRDLFLGGDGGGGVAEEFSSSLGGKGGATLACSISWVGGTCAAVLHHQDAPVPASRKFNPMTKWMKIDKTG